MQPGRSVTLPSSVSEAFAARAAPPNHAGLSSTQFLLFSPLLSLIFETRAAVALRS